MAVRFEKDSSFALGSSPIHLLHRAQQVAGEYFAARLKKSGLTVRQFAVLCALDTHPGGTQTDLVALTGIDRSTLADLIHRLEDRGLVARNRASLDARANSVMLTPAGQKAWREAIPEVQAADEAILAMLHKGKRKALIASLQHVSALGTDQTGKKLKAAKNANDKRKPTAKAKGPDTSPKAAKPQKKSKKRKKKKRGDGLAQNTSPAAPKAPLKGKLPGN